MADTLDTIKTDVQSTAQRSPGDQAAASECRRGLMACGMGHKGLKGLLLMAACCGAPLLLLLALPVLGSALGGAVTAVVPLLAALACPVGMVLMMWLMMRGQQARADQPAPTQPVALPSVATTVAAGPREVGERLDSPPTTATPLAPLPLVHAEVVSPPRSVNGHQTARPALPVNGQQVVAPTPVATRRQAPPLTQE
jgi:hypothetical protein